MGGPGSGRWPRNYKRREVVQSCSSLSIIAMRRGGALVPQKETNGTLFRRDQITQEVDFSIKFRVTWVSPDGPRLWLAYELPGSAERVRYSIQLACTWTNWGGTRSSSCDAGRRETAVAPHPESMRVRSIGSEHIRSHAAFSNPTTSAVWPREQPPCSYHL